jgi:hypothetical protein
MANLTFLVVSMGGATGLGGVARLEVHSWALGAAASFPSTPLSPVFLPTGEGTIVGAATIPISASIPRPTLVTIPLVSGSAGGGSGPGSPLTLAPKTLYALGVICTSGCASSQMPSGLVLGMPVRG